MLGIGPVDLAGNKGYLHARDSNSAVVSIVLCATGDDSVLPFSLSLVAFTVTLSPLDKISAPVTFLRWMQKKIAT